MGADREVSGFSTGLEVQDGNDRELLSGGAGYEATREKLPKGYEVTRERPPPKRWPGIVQQHVAFNGSEASGFAQYLSSFGDIVDEHDHLFMVASFFPLVLLLCFLDGIVSEA